MQPFDLSEATKKREALWEIDRELILGRGDLTHAAMVIFRMLNPSIALDYNWHIGCICEHLRAMQLCQIMRLVINLPPRALKTWLISVIWPSVVWMEDPSSNWIHISYDEDLHEKTAPRRRDIIQSEWFASVARPSWELRVDANKKFYFFNTAGGSSYSTTPGGGGAGFDADYAVFDDPNKVGSTKRQLQDVFNYFSSQIATRGNDPSRYRICVTQQRIDAGDLSGQLINSGIGFQTLILPMHFEPNRICYSFAESVEKKIRYPIVLTDLQKKRPELMDPRTEPGQLLHPSRFPKKAVDDLSASILAGGGTVAGQLEQRPSSEQGTIFQADWFRRFSVDIREINDRLQFCFILFGSGTDPVAVLVSDCRAFIVIDTAVKAKEENDYFVAAYCLFTPNADLLIHSVLRAKISQPYQMEVVEGFFAGDGVWDDGVMSFVPGKSWPVPPLYVAIEDRATGSGLLMTGSIRGLPVKPLEPGRSDKVARAAIASTKYRAGSVYHLANQPWLEVVENELKEFPKSPNDDVVDVISYAARLCATDQLLRSIVRVTRGEEIMEQHKIAMQRANSQGDTAKIRTSVGVIDVHFPE